MTEQEVIDASLAQIPPAKRPAHVSDQGFVETYRSMLKGIGAKREGNPGLLVTWSDVKAKFGTQD